VQFLAILALLAVLLASLVVLQLDGRRRRLEERVGSLPDFANATDAAASARQSIRRQGSGSARAVLRIRDFFGVLVDLDNAKVMPNSMVFAVGILIGLFTTIVAHLYLSMPPSVVIGVIAGLFGVRAIFRWEFRRYAARLRSQLPDAIELLVSTTNSGLPVSEGFRAIAREMPEPTSDEFARIVKEVALGSPVDGALKSLHHRTLVPEYAILAVTLAVQARSGGRLAETISTLADTIRQRMAIVARAHALAGEAKLSAIVLAILPFIGGVMMSLIQPGFLQPLFSDPRGKMLVLVGATTLTLGALTMRWLIRSATAE
jgi:tight adherence protein B